MNIFHLGHVCLLCHQYTQQNYDLCLCHQYTQQNYDLCIECENDLPISTAKDLITPFEYHFPINHMITQLKFEGQLIYAKLLGQLLAKTVSQHYKNTSFPTLIVPIPLHKKRLRERGFNQALEISKTVSHLLKIKIDNTSCVRKKYTAAQSTLDAQKRKENIQHCFELKQPITAEHIAVLDDVITTGETIKALANTIKQASSTTKIDFWCCAHTLI